MHCAIALAALVGFTVASPSPVAAPEPQGVTTTIAPTDNPAGCSPDFTTSPYFQIGVVGANSKRAVPNGVDPNSVPGNMLLLSLHGGNLLDNEGRTGYIAANGQLQFDNPPQTGAIYTAGFYACPNNTLALEDAVWYSCLSGSYSNLYYQSIADYCVPSYLQIVAYEGTVSAVSAGSTTATVGGVATGGAISGTVSAASASASASAPGSAMASSGSMATSSATGTASATADAAGSTSTSTMGNGAHDLSGSTTALVISLIGLIALGL